MYNIGVNVCYHEDDKHCHALSIIIEVQEPATQNKDSLMEEFSFWYSVWINHPLLSM